MGIFSRAPTDIEKLALDFQNRQMMIDAARDFTRTFIEQGVKSNDAAAAGIRHADDFCRQLRVSLCARWDDR